MNNDLPDSHPGSTKDWSTGGTDVGEKRGPIHNYQEDLDREPTTREQIACAKEVREANEEGRQPNADCGCTPLTGCQGICDDKVSVGDLNSTAKGDAARKSSGKVQWQLIPYPVLVGVARVLEFGILKYAEWNWSKGMPWGECMRCTLSHLFKFWFMGQECDEESGEHHLDHVMCNVMFMRHYTLVYKEGDNRPPDWTDFKAWIFGASARYQPGVDNVVGNQKR
jgi:hypothetical protein